MRVHRVHSSHALQLADLRTGVLDRYLPIPAAQREAVEGVLFPQPARAQFVDNVLQKLGFHARESIANRVGIRKQGGGASFQQDPARDKYLAKQRRMEETRCATMCCEASLRDSLLTVCWRPTGSRTCWLAKRVPFRNCLMAGESVCPRTKLQLAHPQLLCWK